MMKKEVTLVLISAPQFLKLLLIPGTFSELFSVNHYHDFLANYFWNLDTFQSYSHSLFKIT